MLKAKSMYIVTSLQITLFLVAAPISGTLKKIRKTA